jgi:hypothetical protein
MVGWRDVCGGAVLGVGAPLTGVWLASVAADRWTVITGPAPASSEEALTALVAVVGAGVAAWLWLGLLLALLGHLPGAVGDRCREVAERTTPAVVRRCAAVVVGAGLAGALAPGTATAADGPLPGGAAASASAPTTPLSPSFSPTGVQPTTPDAGAPSPAFAATSVAPHHPVLAAQLHEATPAPTPGWTPARPSVRPQPSTRLVTTAPPPGGPRETVVRRGDTLWDIARAHLGPDATDAEVAAEWPRWHEANRSVIGPDPDVLLPGQVLHAPDAVQVLR